MDRIRTVLHCFWKAIALLRSPIFSKIVLDIGLSIIIYLIIPECRVFLAVNIFFHSHAVTAWNYLLLKFSFFAPYQYFTREKWCGPKTMVKRVLKQLLSRNAKSPKANYFFKTVRLPSVMVPSLSTIRTSTLSIAGLRILYESIHRVLGTFPTPTRAQAPKPGDNELLESAICIY